MRRTTSVPELLLLIDRKSATPLRAQLERELRAAIRAGRVRPLARLPSTRALAADLGVSRGLVVEAYDQLRLVYRRRRDALVGALRAHVPEAQVHGVAAGLHLMIELRRQVDEQSIVQAAASASVGVYGVQAHRARPGAGPPALLLGYGALSEAAIAVGVERLAAAISTVVRRGAGATPRARPARLCKHRRRSPGLNPKPRGVES
jgi:DNA-binding transcriptional MocR family regulator